MVVRTPRGQSEKAKTNVNRTESFRVKLRTKRFTLIKVNWFHVSCLGLIDLACKFFLINLGCVGFVC